MYDFPDGIETVSTPLGNLAGHSSGLTLGRTIQFSPSCKIMELDKRIECCDGVVLYLPVGWCGNTLFSCELQGIDDP